MDVTKGKHSLELLAHLGAASQKLVSQTMSERTYEINNPVLYQNDWGESIYFIIQGWAKVRVLHIDGNEVTLNILGPDDIFGEMAALEQSPRSSDVIALTPLHLGILPRETFLYLLSHEPGFCRELLGIFARRLRQMNQRLLTRESNSEVRLVNTLMFIAEGQGRTSRLGISIPAFAHRELAALSGLARETVTRHLNDLQKRGLIEKIDHMLRFPNLNQLEALLE